MPPAQLYIEVGYVAQLLAVFLGHHAVLGEDNAHIVPLAGKHGRKRAHYVGQSAGFDEGNAFAGSEQYFHGYRLLFCFLIFNEGVRLPLFYHKQSRTATMRKKKTKQGKICAQCQ